MRPRCHARSVLGGALRADAPKPGLEPRAGALTVTCSSGVQRVSHPRCGPGSWVGSGAPGVEFGPPACPGPGPLAVHWAVA